MHTPQEVQVWYILPALRRHLAIELKERGLKQKQIAKFLRLSEPAVSQYLKNKRGDDIKFPLHIKNEISKSADIIAGTGSHVVQREIQRTFKTITDTKFLCNVCREHVNVDDDCEICYR